MFIQTNPNPKNLYTSDCVVRALAIAQDQSWEKTYLELCIQGYAMGDWGSSNLVWSAYLKDKGVKRYVVPDEYLPAIDELVTATMVYNPSLYRAFMRKLTNK